MEKPWCVENAGTMQNLRGFAGERLAPHRPIDDGGDEAGQRVETAEAFGLLQHSGRVGALGHDSEHKFDCDTGCGEIGWLPELPKSLSLLGFEKAHKGVTDGRIGVV